MEQEQEQTEQTASETASEQTRTPEEIERESLGRLRELQATRRELQTIREQHEEAARRLEELEKTGKGKGGEGDEDDELLVTRKELADREAELVAKLEARQEVKAKEAMARRLETSEAAMRRETERMPEGLDYDSVVEEGRDDLSARDWAEIRVSDKPAKTAYALCLKRNAELAKRVAAAKGKRAGSTLLGDGVRPPRRSPPAVEDEDVEADGVGDDIENVSDAELDRMFRRLQTKAPRR